jgi:small subunit ribosomal protein S21
LNKLIYKKEGGIPLAIVVEVQEDNLEKALRTLKKKMQLDGLQRELKNRRFYEKPSVKRRRKMQDAERRRRKARRRRV